jgi:CheY-like chemotaxis protein
LAGHEITEADGGLVALQLATAQAFDLIITDIVMPDLDGAELIMSLQAKGIRSPIIAMSGGGAHMTSQEALMMAKETANASLTKPFDAKQLMEVVNRLLAEARVG